MKNNRLETRNISVEFRALEDDSRKVSGLAIPVERRSELLHSRINNRMIGFYETISRDAINDDLINSMDVKLYLNHDDSQGTYARSKYGEGSLKLFITERGLEFETELPNTVFGDMLLEGIRRGDYDALSFAFIPEADEWSDNPDGTRNRMIRSFELLDELSILSVAPAYSQTEVSVRSLEEYEERKEQEEQDRKNSILNKLDEKLIEINEQVKDIEL
jgi:HK97 family phage prohead protease